MPSRHAADIRQVAQKTGRSLDEWCELLEANGVGDRREAVNMLRDSYAVSHAFALAIADKCLRRERRRVGRRRLRRRRGGRSLVVMEQAARQHRHQRRIVAEDGRRYAFADHNCFACGRENPIGMGLHIELGEGTARTAWTAGDDFVGWSDKAHGGIIATLLDEVMAWAPRASTRGWSPPRCRFDFDPRPSRRGMTATGRVVEQRRRIYQVSGEVLGADGRLIAEGPVATWVPGRGRRPT